MIYPGEYSMGTWEECVFCCRWVVCSICVCCIHLIYIVIQFWGSLLGFCLKKCRENWMSIYKGMKLVSSSVTLWFWFTFPCWLLRLSTFSYICWPFVCLPWKNVCSCHLSFFFLIFFFSFFFFLLLTCMNFLYILNICLTR